MAAPNTLEARRLKDALPPSIVLGISLSDGTFETSIHVPLTKADEFQTYVTRWLGLAGAALQQGVENMQASLLTEKEAK